jgi:hypothetical protein
VVPTVSCRSKRLWYSKNWYHGRCHTKDERNVLNDVGSGKIYHAGRRRVEVEVGDTMQDTISLNSQRHRRPDSDWEAHSFSFHSLQDSLTQPTTVTTDKAHVTSALSTDTTNEHDKYNHATEWGLPGPHLAGAENRDFILSRVL